MVMIRTEIISLLLAQRISAALLSPFESLGNPYDKPFNLDQFYFVKYVLFARCSYFLFTVDFFVTDSIM